MPHKATGWLGGPGTRPLCLLPFNTKIGHQILMCSLNSYSELHACLYVVRVLSLRLTFISHPKCERTGTPPARVQADKLIIAESLGRAQNIPSEGNIKFSGIMKECLCRSRRWAKEIRYTECLVNNQTPVLQTGTFKYISFWQQT